MLFCLILVMFWGVQCVLCFCCLSLFVLRPSFLTIPAQHQRSRREREKSAALLQLLVGRGDAEEVAANHIHQDGALAPRDGLRHARVAHLLGALLGGAPEHVLGVEADVARGVDEAPDVLEDAFVVDLGERAAPRRRQGEVPRP